MLPALAALGFGALGVGSLIKQIYQANTDPDPKDIEKVIDDKAINISRQNGIPVDMVKQQIREDTIKEMKADREFNWGDAAFNALSIVPGGMVAKGLGAAAKAGGLAGGKAALSEMTGLGGAIGKRTAKAPVTAVAEAEAAAAKTGPAAKQAGATVKASGEEAAEAANPAMRAAHGAEEVGEYGPSLPIDIMPGMPAYVPDLPGYQRAVKGADDMFRVGLQRRFARTAGMGD